MAEQMSSEEKLLLDPASSGLTGEALTKALVEAAERHPIEGFMFIDNYVRQIPQSQIGSFLQKLVRKNPSVALSNAKSYVRFLDPNDGLTILREAVKLSSPSDVLLNASSFVQLFPQNEKRQILFDAADKDPITAISYTENYMSFLSPEDQKQVIRAAADKDPYSVFLNAADYKKYFSAQETENILLSTAQKNPTSGFTNLISYIDFISEKEKGFLVNRLARQTVDGMGDIFSVMYSKKFESLLQDDVKVDLEACRTLGVGALTVGQELNAAHTLPEVERFAPIQDYDARQLYNLITFGREELYTSSYAGVLDRLVEKLKQSNQSIFDVHDPRFGKALPVFMEAAAAYDKLDKVIPLIPADKWGDVLNSFGQRIEKGDTQMAVGLADIMQKTEDPALKARMETFVQDQYTRHAGVRDEIADVYGVLGNYYNHLTQAERIHLNTPERYQTSAMKGLTPEELRGPDGVHRQMSVFTNDEDGNNSFSHFMERYRENDKYKIEDKGEYVRITPTNGAKMEIYANKPAGSPDAVLKALGGPDAKPEDVPLDLVIHRGHSYNFSNTLPYVSRHNALIFVGSCGGYQNITSLLQRSPEAQVISTHATGSMAVNDPLLYHINESIRTGQPLVWEKERKYLQSLDSQHKDAYVLPDQNTALLMRQRLNDLERERTNPEPLPVRPESALPPANDFNAIAASLSPRDPALPDTRVDLRPLHQLPQPETGGTAPPPLPETRPRVNPHLPNRL